jgi:predicted porin
MFYKLSGVTGLASAVNVRNNISYYTPTMGGFSAGVQRYFGENTQGVTGSNDNGTGYSVYADFSAGPFFGTIAQSVTSTASTAADGEYTQRALALSYNFGAAKLVYTYAQEEAAVTGRTPKNTENLIGVIVPFGAVSFKASYIMAVANSGAAGATDNKGELIGLGVDYSLSKRTKLYATYAGVTNKDQAAGAAAFYSTGISDGKTNNSSNNYAFGVFHAF